MALGPRKGAETLPLDMGGHEIQNVQCSLRTPQPNGVADPGSSHEISDADHVHPGTNPAVEGAYLYPAKVEDPLLRDPVKCLSLQGSGYGLLFSQWTQIAGICTWQKNYTAPIQGFKAGGDPMELVVGDRFAVVNTYPLFEGEEKYSGIYELLVQGNGVDTYAVIRRTADANTAEGLCHDMVFEVTGEGAGFEGTFWRLTTADPITVDTTVLAFENLANYTENVSYPLCTAQQLVTLGATADVQELEATIGAGGTTALHYWLTPAGSPNLTSLPAGMQEFSVDAVSVDVADPANPMVLRAEIYRCDSGGTIEEKVLPASGDPEMESPPILSITPARLTWQYNVDEAISLNTANRLEMALVAHNPSASAVTITVRWSTTGRLTFWKTTAQFPASGGTNYHPDLLGRATADQHPWSAIEPVGVATVPMPDLTIAADGKLTLGEGNVFVVDPDGQSLDQITPPACGAHETVPITLIFTGPVSINHQTVPASGFATLYVAEAPNSPIYLGGSWSSAQFVYVGGQWVLTSCRSTQ